MGASLRLEMPLVNRCPEDEQTLSTWEGIGRGWLQGVLGDWFSFSAALYDIGLRAGQVLFDSAAAEVSEAELSELYMLEGEDRVS